jgi:uncharacterized membrane protein
MIVLDFIYIRMNKDLFDRQVINIQRVVPQYRMEGAVLCYLLLIFGLYYFILSKRKTILDAFLFGIIIYGVYETTTYTIFKKWSHWILLMDTIWGGVLMGSTTLFTYLYMGYMINWV